MKQLKKTFAGKLLVLSSAMGLATAFAAPPAPTLPAAAAAAAVYQRTTNTDSVELSNLDEADPSQAAVPVTAGAQAGTPAAEPKTAVARNAPATKPAKKVKKKVRLADGSEEEQWVEEDADSTEQADANGSAADRTASGSRSEDSGSMGFNAASGSSAGSSGGYTGGYAGGGTAGNTTGNSGGYVDNTAGQSSGVATGSTGTTDTTGGAGTGTTASTGTTPGTYGSGPTTLPTPTSALEVKLDAYRAQMLREVTNAQAANPNPALTRRYQMMNRGTYQSLKGM
jgi:hypothetical protein